MIGSHNMSGEPNLQCLEQTRDFLRLRDASGPDLSKVLFTSWSSSIGPCGDTAGKREPVRHGAAQAVLLTKKVLLGGAALAVHRLRQALPTWLATRVAPRPKFRSAAGRIMGLGGSLLPAKL